MLQLDRLRLHSRLLCHEAFLLYLKVGNDVLQVADRLVQEVASVVLVRDLGLQLGEAFIEFVSLRILRSDFCLQILHLCLAVILQLLLVFLKLHQLVVEHLDLFLLCSENVLMVALKPVVVHLSVTLVTYSMWIRIVFGEWAALVTTGVTDCAAASLTVLLDVTMQDFKLACECSLAQHASVRVELSNGPQIESLRQGGLL